MRPILLIALFAATQLAPSAWGQTASQTGGSLRGTVKFVSSATRWLDSCPENTTLAGRSGRLLAERLYTEAATDAGYDVLPVWEPESPVTIVGVRCGEVEGNRFLRVTVRITFGPDEGKEGYLDAPDTTQLEQLIAIDPSLKAVK